MNKRVIVVGAGGHAQVVADALLRMEQTSAETALVGYVDDNPLLIGQYFLGLPVLGGTATLGALPHDGVVIGIGDNRVRQRFFQSLRRQGENLVTVRHPSTVVAADVTVGDGSVIFGGVVVNTGSNVGADVILNTACSVDHHNIIGDHVHIAPGVHLGGDVSIGEGAFIGIGATVMPQRTVGEWSVVGAGAVVTKNVPPYSVVVGAPARVIRELTPNDNKPPAGGHN